MENKLVELFNIPNIKVEVDTIWLFNHIMKDNYFSAHLMIRLLAIRNYFNENDYGWKLYNKMQNERVASNPLVPKYMADHEEQFKELIESMKQNSFDYNHPITINKDFMIVDGAHRLATALYFGLEKVPVTITKKSYYDKVRDYSIDWFKEHNLNDCVEPALSEYTRIRKVYGDKNGK